jgi:hypothetical protein
VESAKIELRRKFANSRPFNVFCAVIQSAKFAAQFAPKVENSARCIR